MDLFKSLYNESGVRNAMGRIKSAPAREKSLAGRAFGDKGVLLFDFNPTGIRRKVTAAHIYGLYGNVVFSVRIS